jgi:putative DNA methylase
MTPQYPKRLIEVDLPIKRISAHARREKSIRHGHISTLHIWWARRPLAACRAVICASLWPDPVDPLCPQDFRNKAAKLITDFANSAVTNKALGESCDHQTWIKWQTLAKGGGLDGRNEAHWNVLRFALLDFIADFANWDNSTVQEYLETSAALTQSAHEALGGAPGTRPLVVDPFSGGGSIPLEALRVGADAFASDLNPVAVLLNKVVLEYIPKYGQQLADEVRKWGEWIKLEAEKELAEFYPKDADDSTPIAYLWARTVKCEGPRCGAEIPLLRSFLLAKRRSRSVILKIIPESKTKVINFRVSEGDGTGTTGTIRKGSTTCPICGFTTPNVRVRAQLTERNGGAEDARLIAVVTNKASAVGRFYRTPTKADISAANHAREELKRREKEHRGAVSLVPNECIPTERPSPNARGLSAVTRMGVRTFGELFTPRQALTLSTFARLIGEVRAKLAAKHSDGFSEAVQTILAFGLDRLVDRNSTLCRWDPTPTASGIINTFSRQALSIMWDFAEGTPFENKSGGWIPALEWTALVVERESQFAAHPGQIEQASATSHPLPNDAAQAFVTDPPYYDAIPYADLSDFFYVWMRRSLPHFTNGFLHSSTTPKDEEAIWNPGRIYTPTGKPKDTAFYEAQMAKALEEGRRITAPSGVGVVVFAHKSTAGWEAILSALINAGWIATASWPVDTEMGNRMNAMGTASLASSVHIVCRPRENPDGSVRSDEIGDWRDLLQELPRRIHEWMPRLAEEGVVGADAIFACLGPALEIFSRYSRVEKASGEAVALKEYLEHVWAAVAKEALAMVFKGADATGFEADARLTAMWLWTLISPDTNGNTEDSDEESDSEDEPEAKKTKISGFMLEYDAARKIAQGLGANLEGLGHLVEIAGDKARLLPVSERTRHLFGRDEEEPARASSRKKKSAQLDMFAELTGSEDAEVAWREKTVKRVGDTTLDRVHQGMILFAAGRGEALKRFVVEDGVGQDGKFWRLAQALSALYPSGSDEKRWVDGVLARKKQFGF